MTSGKSARRGWYSEEIDKTNTTIIPNYASKDEGSNTKSRFIYKLLKKNLMEISFDCKFLEI